MTICRSILTVLAAITASISLAGPIRLGTTFFSPPGLTNPVVLDARVGNSQNFLLMATEADATGGGKHIVITKFNDDGTRRWSSTINTSVSVAATGQTAGKFQILPDDASNTYVLSPRDGNPDFPTTTEDLILRRLDHAGQRSNADYLSIVRYLAEQTGKELSVSNGRMLLSKKNPTEIVLAVTAIDPEGFWSVYVLYIQNMAVLAYAALPGSYIEDADGWMAEANHLIGLTPSGTPDDPRMRLTFKREHVFESYGSSVGFENMSLRSCEVNTDADAGSISLSAPTTTELDGSLGFQAEGLGFSEDQELVLSWLPENDTQIFRRASSFESVVLSSISTVPYTATRIGDNWLVYGHSTAGTGEFFLKFPTVSYLTAIPFSISDASLAPYYAGNSLTSARGRAYLAGGPTVNGFQGIYSSFNDLGELVYSAGVKQPLTLSTSFVVPTTDNRFWTVGTTSTGLQAVILWKEPEYFVGISSRSSARRGDTVTIKAHLSTPAPTGGYTFNVSVSSNLQDAPRTVTVPAGNSSATFTVKVKSTATAGPATVTARTNATHDINTAHTATFTIN